MVNFDLRRAVGGGSATHVALCENVRSYFRHWSGLLRNFLISPLEGEKKFLSELREFRNFREGYNLKYICRNGNSDLQLKRKVAFTLAEVLVTLGIIGVVSAMTVPTLVQNYQRKSYVTQLHKVYNELGQASLRYMTDHNYVSLRESRIVGNKDELNRFVKTYFKVVKDCEGKLVGCFATEYGYIENNETVNLTGWSCWSTVVLPSGAAVCFDTGASESTPSDEDINNDGVIDENDKINNSGVRGGAVITINVDVNGKQGPNIWGRDLFALDISADGTVFDAGNSYVSQIMDAGWEMNY